MENSALWGFLGTLIGACTSIITTLIVNANSKKLQIEAISLQYQEKQKNFQRETILELQEYILKCMRSITQIYLHDKKTYQNENIRVPIPDKIDAEYMENIRKLVVLEARIIQDSLRLEISDFRNLMSDMALANTAQSSSDAFDNIFKQHVKVIDALGEAIRNEYS